MTLSNGYVWIWPWPGQDWLKIDAFVHFNSLILGNNNVEFLSNGPWWLLTVTSPLLQGLTIALMPHFCPQFPITANIWRHSSSVAKRRAQQVPIWRWEPAGPLDPVELEEFPGGKALETQLLVFRCLLNIAEWQHMTTNVPISPQNLRNARGCPWGGALDSAFSLQAVQEDLPRCKEESMPGKETRVQWSAIE